jgi:hypothetical protein
MPSPDDPSDSTDTSASPFPLEERAQTDNLRPTWNPWSGPTEPSWHAGMGFDDETAYLGPMYRVLEAAGSGAAKGEAMLGGMMHVATGAGPIQVPGMEEPKEDLWANAADAVSADAKQRVQAMTPNAATTGTALSLIHNLVSGGTEMAVGGLLGGPLGAAAVVGGSEGHERYQQLKDQGVNEGTAKASGALAGVTAGVGALMPAGIGESLLSKVVTGAVGNTAFGGINRYADHKILDAAGYHEMADQQRVFDGTQVLTDLILGGAFGALAHYHSSAEAKALKDAPGATDAALTANLALRDRQTAPGIAADPEAANAHQEALEKAITDMLSDKPVDVSDARVTDAHYLQRAELPDPEMQSAMHEYFQESEVPDLKEPALEAPAEGTQEPIVSEAPEGAVREYLSDVPQEPEADAPTMSPPQTGRMVKASGIASDLVGEGFAHLAGGNPFALVKFGQAAAELVSPTMKRERVPGSQWDQYLKREEAKTRGMIPDEDGKLVPAAKLLARVQEELATTRRESQIATQAAIKCYMSRGAG